MKKFDIIIPIGSSCAAAQALRETKKRSCSFPLDWVGKTPLPMSVDFIENHFQDFFNKQDLVHDPERDNRKNIGYVNTRTKLLFLHDFKDENKFDEEYAAVKEKYDRRIERIYSSIAAARRVLFFYLYEPWSDNWRPVDADILTDFERLQALFPKKDISLLYVFLNSDKGEGFSKRKLSDKVDFIDCFEAQGGEIDENFRNYCKYRANIYHLLEDYPVKRNWKDYFRKLGYKTLDALCKLLPAKKLKERVRMMYKEYK